MDVALNGNEIRVLVLGASGMLGNAVFRFLSRSRDHAVTGTVRSSSALSLLPEALHGRSSVGWNSSMLTG